MATLLIDPLRCMSRAQRRQWAKRHGIKPCAINAEIEKRRPLFEMRSTL